MANFNEDADEFDGRMALRLNIPGESLEGIEITAEDHASVEPLIKKCEDRMRDIIISKWMKIKSIRFGLIRDPNSVFHLIAFKRGADNYRRIAMGSEEELATLLDAHNITLADLHEVRRVVS